MAYDNTNTGALFVKKERKNDKQPNFQGKINVNGKEYDIAAWTRESKTGDKYLSLKIEEPRDKKQTTQSRPQVDYGDDLPF